MNFSLHQIQILNAAGYNFRWNKYTSEFVCNKNKEVAIYSETSDSFVVRSLDWNRETGAEFFGYHYFKTFQEMKAFLT